jgi:hypothetical protein
VIAGKHARFTTRPVDPNNPAATDGHPMADGTVTVVEDARGVNTPPGAAPPPAPSRKETGANSGILFTASRQGMVRVFRREFTLDDAYWFPRLLA